MSKTKDDETYSDSLFYRVSSRAFMRNGQIEYTGEQLMLALLLHAKGKRTKQQTDFVGKLLDDPNQIGRKRPVK